jgi:Flp pilus assembly protein TadG
VSSLVAARVVFNRIRQHIVVRPVTDDGGNAVLEFVVLAAFLMVPLIYIIMAVAQVQGSAYGVTEATREAGRAFVGAATSTDASRDA